MNETLEQLYRRKSVRVFEDREISAEEKECILQGAFMAPTAGDQQLYTVIDVTDPSLKHKLAESCDHQPFIAEAKMLLIFLADCSKWYLAYEEAGCEPRKPGSGDFLLAVDDALIAAQNAVVAAESMGIGSCYIGDIMEQYELHRRLLGLPPYVFPAAMLVFGYPTARQRERTKPPRAKREHMVYENGYPKEDAVCRRKRLERYAGNREYTEWLQAFCTRKYNSNFSREMTRSVDAFLSTLSPAEIDREDTGTTNTK